MNIPYKKEIKICFTCALFIALILGLVCLCCCRADAASPFIETPNLSIDSFMSSHTDNFILQQRQEWAHTMAECARNLGYPEDCETIVNAKKEWSNCEEQIKKNLEKEQVWKEKFEEYPYATYVWLFFARQMGYSEEVTAGILGNIMTECGGGGTLDLHYWAYGSGGFYYGMCQWGKTWFPEVRGMNLIEQCNYLAGNIETQINAFGKSYGKANAFSEFLELTSCRDAALMFAQLYEACSSAGYGFRQNCAEKAYEYFTTGLN